MDLDQLHHHSINHREELSRSKNCGCFSCRRIYPVSEIEWWIDDDQTAICPYCDTDAVIGDACGVEITPELLEEMYDKYFKIDIEDIEDYDDDDSWHGDDEDWDEDYDDEEEDEDNDDWDEDYYDEDDESDQENDAIEEEPKEDK